MATTVGIRIVDGGGGPLRLIYYSRTHDGQIECTPYNTEYITEYSTNGR